MNILSILLTASAIGKDVTLPLPVPEWLLVVVLILMFLVHLVFINLMLGGTILSFVYQVLGKKNKEYITLSEEIGKTITVNKSLAVVMGVAPLLAINTLYTKFFYTANSLTGLVWLLVVPLVIVSFLLIYLHKYTFKTLENRPQLHLSILGGALAIFLFIPFIFLTNINLMLFPDKWAVVRGFWDALLFPSVFTRYFHFINASLALTGLFLVGYMGSEKYAFQAKFKALNRKELQRQFYKIAFYANLAQFVVGTLNLLALPTIGIEADVLFTILGGAVIAIIPTYYLWKEVKASAENVGKYFVRIVVFFSVTVLFMGTGRHLYRANAVRPYQEEMKVNTDKYLSELKAAQQDAKLKAAQDAKNGISGKKLFESKCIMCHAVSQAVVGPSMTEVVGIYKGNNEGLKNWINVPGKKRANSSQMPGFKGQFSDDEMDALLKYVLEESLK